MPIIMKYDKDEIMRLEQLLETYLRKEEFKKMCEEAYIRYRMKHKQAETLE